MPEDVVLEAGCPGLRAGSAGFGLAMVGSIGRADSVSWAGGLGSTGNLVIMMRTDKQISM